MNTKRRLAALPAGILAALFASAAGQVQAAETFTEVFTQGKAHFAFRYRLEHVDEDNFDKNALASTIRARLNFKTSDWKGWGLFAEYDFVTTIGADDFNAGAGNTPDKAQYPVVADPSGPDLNQAYLYWKPAEGSDFRAGRQRIIYDNARFVGNVGWRQNEQTYDAVSYRFKNKGGIDLQFAYIGNANRIFGDEVNAGDHSQDTWTANVAKSWKIGKLTGYYYDIDNHDLAAFSTTTYGVRFNGKQKVGSTMLGYTAEYAHQSDTTNNPVDYSADYWRFDFSVTFGSVTPYIAYESLGGDDTRGGAMFRTPLATLHAFNGWADKFLATPAAGLNDAMIGVKGKVFGSWKWNVVYHDFDAESGSASYGKEIDAALSTKFAEHYGVLFKAAWFDGKEDSGPPDTVKLWFQLTANF